MGVDPTRLIDLDEMGIYGLAQSQPKHGYAPVGERAELELPFSVLPPPTVFFAFSSRVWSKEALTPQDAFLIDYPSPDQERRQVLPHRRSRHQHRRRGVLGCTYGVNRQGRIHALRRDVLAACDSWSKSSADDGQPGGSLLPRT